MSFYLWIWIDIAVYTILFKLIFDQLSRVVEFRFYKTYDDWIPKLSIVHEESAFLRQMKDLRRLYMTVLGSLRRSKIIIGGVVESLAVSVCLQLTWLLFVTIMGITGTVELDTKYFAFCVRHIVQWSLLVLLARTCDKIQVLVEGMSAILFRVPSARMDGGEIKEIEIFVKLLGWEQPLKSANDKGPFGRSFLCSLTIDILVNCMVITQLYFWFNK
ncbi:hypothetical protein JTB14_018015 [Gonioctena quinquepunctata]|nr:hypothetical protein JTB14_018015 [Gonioctena quinquepunctata]